MWYDEVGKYTYSTAQQPGTGHYTQVVWANSKRIGCGAAYCKSAEGLSYSATIVVCRYLPGGNYIGDLPYVNSSSNCNTCAAMGYQCGTYTDNCSKTVTCDSCNSSETCINHKCIPKSCTPKTTCNAGYECGTMHDGCGGNISCGTCAAGLTCNPNTHKCMYDLTFDFDNGTAPEVRKYSPGDRIVYPENPTKEGHTFARWNSSATTMLSKSFTITAQWTVNSYTVKFYFTNESDFEVKTFYFGEAIAYPKDLQNGNLTFNGWDKIPSFTPAQDINITAQWRETPVRYAEIVFDKEGLKKADIEDVVKGYTNETFVVKYTEGESKAVVVFDDEAKCVEYVKNVNENKKAEDSFIVSVNGIDYDESFSFVSVPSAVLGFMVL